MGEVVTLDHQLGVEMPDVLNVLIPLKESSRRSNLSTEELPNLCALQKETRNARPNFFEDCDGNSLDSSPASFSSSLVSTASKASPASSKDTVTTDDLIMHALHMDSQNPRD